MGKNNKSKFILKGKYTNIDFSKPRSMYELDGLLDIIKPSDKERANKAGFAKDMVRYYKSVIPDSTMILPENETSYKIREYVNLSDEKMETVKKKYHKFIFKSDSHKFMETASKK